MKARIKGGQTPYGVVQVSGAKNAATRMLAAALLSDEPITLTNFPTHLVDVGHKVRFMVSVGAKIDMDHATSRVSIDASSYGASETNDYDIPIRTTYLLAAGQLLRRGRARIPYPGGCKIGARGYDQHVMVWQQLGCAVTEQADFIELVGTLRGGHIDFPISTVGGTETALLCGTVATGDTEITNAYITPEIENEIELLRAMGARIEVIGSSRIVIKGVPRLGGATVAVMPDRIEALTWIVYGLLSGGTLRIDGVPFEAMKVPLIHMQAAGIDLLTSSSSAYIYPGSVGASGIQPFEVACGTHPGVISDMQPFFVMLGLAANGRSHIYDYRYPERIGYVAELAKLCSGKPLAAEIGRITAVGPTTFRAAEATSTDLRGSMALIMAALLADGSSTINDAHMAFRGYNALEAKLAALGVDITLEG